jgi:D-alanyl-D-alanine carboxypeptidase
MQLAEEKRFDPHAPITRYLPSLVVHSRFAPITGHDLLSHTAGLPNYLPDSASSRFAAVQLRDFTPTYAPGTHFWYSNTGYQLLGYVLENIERSSYTEILRRRVLEPLKMTSTSAVIDDAQRTKMVVSYVRWPYDGSYVEAPWFEYSAGDGSIVANVSDMAAYTRVFLNKGAGVLSEKAFAALTIPVLEDYAYGLRVRTEEGRSAHGRGVWLGVSGQRSARPALEALGCECGAGGV